jgi:hypothetical protein
MRCLSCGCTQLRHSYADGRCQCGGCAAFVEKWPVAIPEKKPLTVDKKSEAGEPK